MSNNYSNILRNIKKLYPNAQVKIQRNQLDSKNLDLCFDDTMTAITIKPDWTWEGLKNPIKSLINGRNSKICDICFQDNTKLWNPVLCGDCGVSYCGLCYTNSIKINNRVPPCPFCRKEEEDQDDEVCSLSFYLTSYETLYKGEIDTGKLINEFFE